MKFKRFHFLLLMTLLFAVSASAQIDRRIGREQYKRGKNKDKVDFIDQMVDYYKTELKLDDFQEAAIRQVLEGERSAILTLNQTEGMTKDEIRDKAKTINDRVDAKILPLLNDTQKKKYQEFIDKREY